MEEPFKIPWIHRQDVRYVKRGMYRLVIYARRHFYYDVFLEFCSRGETDIMQPSEG